MSFINAVLEKERNILKQVGHEMTESNTDRNYPATYYNSYSENLYEPMGERHEKEYGGGAGGELNSSGKRPAKMASIRSSSAMTFNLLGNDTIIMKENKIGHTPGKYKIEYEKQLNTICNGRNQRPANLDVLLVSENEDELIFCEMKMLEWFTKNTGRLKEAYKEAKNYFLGKETAQFLKAIEMIEALGTSQRCFEYYDVWQMYKHTLAIYNYMTEKGWENYRKITLVNVVFEPISDVFEGESKVTYEKQVALEHEGFQKFFFALEEVGLLGGKTCFDVQYVSTKEFMSYFKITDDKKDYLRRYTLEGLQRGC